MADELDLSGAVDMLKNMLNNEEGQQQIQNIVSMLGGENQTEQPQKTNDPDNIEMIMKLQKVMSIVNDAENSRQAAFLRSLAPLLKPERRDKLNKAVRLLGMGKAIEVLKQT